jgi:AraC-like DNA-binding protein
MARLRALHQGIMGLIPSARGRGADSGVAKAAEHALLAAVVDCLEGEGSVTAPRLGNRNSTAVMRKLYELLDESEGIALYLMDVCARLGVSRRTLHTACAEHLGLGPHRFLWLRRMQLARQALIAADPRFATVTGIATDLGFWELGRFSVHYKYLFGESPSATLGRRRL